MNDSSKCSRRNSSQLQLARTLGWFSIGLGLAEILMPRQLTRMVGAREHSLLLRLLGLREITSGLGILTQRKKDPWMWSRVGGDAMDLALLGLALAGDGTSRRGRLAVASAAVAGVTALDVYCSEELTRHRQQNAMGHQNGPIRVKKSVTINRSREELYQFWSNFENLPRFMIHLDSVQRLGDNRSHWIAKAPGGKQVEWNAETTADVPNEMISWRSLAGSSVSNSGTVRFLPTAGGRGTIVQVEMEYNPPGGVIGGTIAKLFREDPAKQVDDDLHHFKQFMETGVLTTTRGQPAGRASTTSKKFDRAMPAPERQPALQTSTTSLTEFNS